MIRYYTLLLSLVVFLPLQAQITISNSVFPEVGDTLSTRVDITPMINFNPMQGMQSWTFNGLSSPALIENVFQTVDQGTSDMFTGADMVNIMKGGSEYYYKSTPSTFAEVGYYAIDPLVGEVFANAKYTNPLVLRYAPLKYGDIHNQNTNLLVPFSADILPDSILNMLPVKPDSLRVRVNIKRNDTVSGYGTLTLNQHDFSVLQEKRVEQRMVFIDAKVPFFGWQDITDILKDQYPRFGENSADTLISYYYFSEGIKEAIAVVSVDKRDTPQRVEFKDIQSTSSSAFFDVEDIELTASPNPGIGVVEFRVANAPAGNYKIKVQNIMGQALWQKSFFVQGRESLRVDLTHLKRGTYFYSLIDEDGNSIITKRLVFIRA